MKDHQKAELINQLTKIGRENGSFDRLPECRWSESPFKQIKDGKECLVES